jgi:hypothetical protein
MLLRLALSHLAQRHPGILSNAVSFGPAWLRLERVFLEQIK